MTTKNKTAGKPKFDASFFTKVKESLDKDSGSGGGGFGNIMKFPAGHTYTLRLLPNLEDPAKTTFHHYVHNWTSKATGQFTSALSLQTFGERDPISEARWKLFSAWKKENPNADNKDFDNEIMQKEQWFVNVYVVEDPSNSENDGTVKVLRMGPQIKNIIDEATEGDRADELGWDIFDLSKPHDLKIKAEKKGVYTTYENSFISTKSKLDLSEDEQSEIYEKIHDLEAIQPVKTYDELQDILNEHFFVGAKADIEERKPLRVVEDIDTSDLMDNDDDIPMDHDTDEDEELKKLLEGIDD